jgi:hypothetical protein
LAAALQTPDDPSIVKYRQMLTDSLTMARSQIGELAIEGNPAGAEVVVDGRAVGMLPLSASVKLAAREAEVIVRAPGYAARRQLVKITGGQRQALTIDLEKIEKPAEAPPAVAPAAVSPSAPVGTSTTSAMPVAPASLVVDERTKRDGGSSGSTSTLRTAAWVVGAGAIVAAAAGVAFNLTARSNSADFNGSCVNMDGIHMVPGQPLSQGECEARADAWQSDRRWSIAGYVTGAVFAVTSGILFWISQPKSPRNDRAQLRCTPTLAGLSCQGLF